MRVSSGILLVLGFLVPLGFYQNSSMCNKYSKSCYALGSPIAGPWVRIRQAQRSEGSSC